MTQEKKLKLFSYSVQGNSIWTSFDYGEVEAENHDQALDKAIKQLKCNFNEVNEVLSRTDSTKGCEVSFDSSSVEIKEISKD